MKKIILIILCCFITACLCAAAEQEQLPAFKRLSVDDGLSQSSVFAIVQDADGALWFGSGDGLNRYDGYTFDIFFNDLSDSSSIANNHISCLFIDSKNRLWIGTSAGLSLFDRTDRKFSNFRFANKNLRVNTILELKSPNSLMLATSLGVIFFDIPTESYKFVDILDGIPCHTLCYFNDNVLIGTSKGLFAYSPSYGNTSRITRQLDKCDIADIMAVSGKECYIATFGKGIFKIDNNFNVVEEFSILQSGSRGLSSNNIRVLNRDNKGNFWIGTMDGLYKYDPSNDRFTEFRNDYNNPSSISHNSIRSILFDDQNGMWIGTYYGGVSYHNPLLNNFKQLQRSSASNSLGDNIVSALVEDGRTGNLFIGTNDNGVNYYNRALDRFSHITDADKPGGIKSNNIKVILPDTDSPGSFYVGTHAGGVSYVNTKTGAVQNFTLPSDIHINNSCYSLLDNGDGTLWVGTLNGLMVFDKKSRTIKQHPMAPLRDVLNNKMIFTQRRDSRNRIWIGTDQGLYLLSSDRNRFEPVNMAQENIPASDYNVWVMTVEEDSQGNIWIGAREGLFRYNDGDHHCDHYTTKDGLANNYVYGILEDDNRNLWISTNGGLSRFNPAENSFRNYSKSDGLCSNQFNAYSYCKSSDGELYFGGINGITRFYPSQLSDNVYAPRPQIYDVSILKTKDSGISVSHDSLGRVTAARFSSRYNHFEIKFVVINPVSAQQNTYRYMLKGFDKEWQTTRNRSVNYSNLSPGNYTFVLYSANSAGVWCDEPATVQIRIIPQWYQTLFAKICYLLAAMAAIYLGYRFFISRAKMRMQLAIERMEKKKIEELSEDKIRFYINISHELRTPLALILAPLQELMNSMEFTKFARTRLEYIHRNSSKLLHIINQLLEYRKAELGVLAIKVSMTDVEKCLANVFSMFEDNALNRDMDYIFNSSITGKEYPCDKMFLEIVATNLISNAFKFTPDAGSIKLSLTEEKGRLMIRVWDSGIGIEPGNREKIFERFFQENDSYSGTGIGLSIVKKVVELHHGTVSVESEPNKFTEFTISLPTDIGEYSTDELATDRDKRNHSTYKFQETSLFLEKPADREAITDVYDEGLAEESREQLLIVEDNKDLLNYLLENFSQKYRVFPATNGHEALNILKKNEIDVVITDLMMEGMSGIELCRQIKQNLKTCHISVVILTAKDGIEDQQKGIEAGADDYLQKPFSVSILNGKIANLLKSKHRYRNYYSTNNEIEPEKLVSNRMDGEFLKRAIKIIEDNMTNADFSTADFCRELGMSRSSLHLKLTSLTGESGSKFIKKIKFGYACKLLNEGTYNVTEISEMVGFSSPSYFSTSFRKYIGCMPSEYIKNKGQG